MDSRCTNLCPIISHEYALAAKRLASTTSEVEFVAVNVNARHAKVSDVAAFSRKYGLERLPHWHFLTGPPNVLKRVWKAYGVSVYDTPSSGVVHGVDMYFIDDQSRMRWLASPGYDQSVDSSLGQRHRDRRPLAPALVTRSTRSRRCARGGSMGGAHPHRERAARRAT